MSGQMVQLAFDFDFDTEPVAGWVPIYRMFGGAGPTDRICRDCGGKANGECGGANERGYFLICTLCDGLDRCEKDGDSTHLSHWGKRHSEADHEAAHELQEKRRTAYLKRVPV